MILTPQITVCICTFKRAGLLEALLPAIESQRTDGCFTHDIVVVDNDEARSAEQVVRQFAAICRIPVAYRVEPDENIALARNMAVDRAEGALLAFIDDDEVPTTDWLYELFHTRAKFHADAVLGPVLARFQQDPAAWVVKGKFFDRPRHRTGCPIKWSEARTGNVLVSKDVCRAMDPPFRPQFGNGGEDVDFFRRATELGYRFVWSDEAIVHELVPPHRCTRRFLMRRALLRGSNFPKQSAHRLRNTLKSVIAVPCYTLALPLLAIRGHHVFVAYLVKLLDHSSRLLAMAGVRLSTERQH
jgi:glycosyltransferase involved in cell wall biosynthesis